jgi:glycosyltransferase involved in cell wall biosynthesis
LGAAVLHYPGTLGSSVSLRRPKQVVTVHYDIEPAHARSVSRLKRAYYATFMRRSRETASAIVVPSHSFGRDFAARWAIPEGKLHVVYHGVRANPGAGGDAQEGGRFLKELGLAPGYLLSITNALPHKNVPCLLEAHSILAFGKEHPVPLVLVGDIPRDTLQGWARELSARGVHIRLDRVILTGVLPYDKVALLYQHAGLMVTATLAESFDMPVLEAMINRCPVVASDLPVHREIGGQALILVMPREPRGFAEACSQVLADSVRRRAMVEKGLQQAAQFSWERTARDTMAVYRSVE